jgi:hypothetical protein
MYCILHISGNARNGLHRMPIQNSPTPIQGLLAETLGVGIVGQVWPVLLLPHQKRVPVHLW